MYCISILWGTYDKFGAVSVPDILNIQGTSGNVTYYFWYCSKITYLPEITSIIVSIAGCQSISYDSNKKGRRGIWFSNRLQAFLPDLSGYFLDRSSSILSGVLRWGLDFLFSISERCSTPKCVAGILTRHSAAAAIIPAVRY